MWPFTNVRAVHCDWLYRVKTREIPTRSSENSVDLSGAKGEELRDAAFFFDLQARATLEILFFSLIVLWSRHVKLSSTKGEKRQKRKTRATSEIAVASLRDLDNLYTVNCTMSWRLSGSWKSSQFASQVIKPTSRFLLTAQSAIKERGKLYNPATQERHHTWL